MLGLQLDHQVLELLDPLNESLGILSDCVSLSHGWVQLSSEWRRREAHEVLELPLKLVVLELQLTELVGQVLVIKDQTLLLLIDNSHLVDKELGSGPLVLGLLDHGESLVGFKELPLVLMDNLLVLLSLPLQLKVMAVDLLLEVKVLLQELVPSSLTLSLSLLKLLNHSSLLDILLR